MKVVKVHEKMKIVPRRYQLRSVEDGTVKVPARGKKSCTGFSFHGPKLWNYLPEHIRKTWKRDIFEDKMKTGYWNTS